MRRDDVITLLRHHESELRHAGVGRLYLFGSAARGEAQDNSDVDVFFDLASPRGFTLFSVAAFHE
ncbi:MAG: nucleotidyltransferase family protein [Caulobacteraceae bacterium]